MSEDPVLDAEIGALWRTEATTFDAVALRRALEEDQAQRRRSEWLSVAVQVVLLPVIAWMDLQGALPLVPGAVSALLLAGVVCSVLTIRWRRRPAPVPASPLEALQVAMASKRRLRRHGVFLATALPIGIGTGYGIAALLDDGASSFEAPTLVMVLLITLAIAASVVCGVRGTGLVRQATRELAALEERRRALEL